MLARYFLCVIKTHAANNPVIEWRTEMLLKDCPVGSIVRFSKWKYRNLERHFVGEFEVKECVGFKYFIDNAGDDCREDELPRDYQFEVIAKPKSDEPVTLQTITLDGKKYKLTPISDSRVIEIDGVTYGMEEV